jgi:hypothetical protein
MEETPAGEKLYPQQTGKTPQKPMTNNIINIRCNFKTVR